MVKKGREDDQVLVTEEVPVKEKVENSSIESETRIDARGVKAFQAMGYKNQLSDNAVAIYKAFKLQKDRLQPGPLTPEGFAFVAIMAGFADGTLNLE